MVLSKPEDKKEPKVEKREIIQVVEKLPVQEIRFVDTKLESGEEVRIVYKTALEVLTDIANSE